MEMRRRRFYSILLAIVVIIFLAIGVQFTFKAAGQAANYYVATSGDDANPGTIDKPLKTLQRCANVAAPGDNCFIRKGTYHETVTPHSGTSGSPITFEAYSGEQVIIDSADAVNGWSQFKNNIYKATVSGNLSDGQYLVSFNGQIYQEARWPNYGSDLNNPTRATVGSSNNAGPNGNSTGSISDPALNQADGTWNGAKVDFMTYNNSVVETGNVTSSTTGQINFNYWKDTDTSWNGFPYFIWHSLNALDSPGEWYYDSTNSALYVWMPGGGAPSGVELRQRLNAFNLNGVSNVTVRGFTFSAANITTDSASSNNLLDSLTFDFATPQLQFNVPAWWGYGGVLIVGSNNQLINSQINDSASAAVYVGGSNNMIKNNTIHGVDYTASDGAGVFVTGSGHQIVSNTIYDAGRSGLNLEQTSQLTVSHNLIYNFGLESQDLGGIYTGQNDGGGSNIFNNLIHDGGPASRGIYLDNNSRNYNVYYNLIWNVDAGVTVNTPSINNNVINNTVDSRWTGVSSWPETGVKTNVQVKNNLFNVQPAGGQSDTTGLDYQNNVISDSSLYVDQGGRNYLLKSGASVINKGLILPPYTNGFVGSAPDNGAYEFGLAAWKAGAVAQATPGGPGSPPPGSGGSPSSASGKKGATGATVAPNRSPASTANKATTATAANSAQLVLPTSLKGSGSTASGSQPLPAAGVGGVVFVIFGLLWVAIHVF